MDRLWAPWRIKYIKDNKQKKCIFCLAAKTQGDYVIFKTRYSTAMLNIYPYNNGHIMISPKRHINRLSQLKEAEILDLFKSLNLAQGLLQKTLNPHGFNIGINISKSAGAGIASHMHMHIVPRWRGDSNFMSAVYNTRIISQSLAELYKLLKINLKNLPTCPTAQVGTRAHLRGGTGRR